MKQSLFLGLLWLVSLTAEANWNEVESATLLISFADNPTQWVAPCVESDVHIQISGPVARTRVEQTFTNLSSDWAHATYLFPLPETAAVDHMRLRVGERVIEGKIMEKTTAKATFEKAKSNGKKASLVSQQRNNLFTTDIANIPPGESLVVTIEYQHPVDKEGDTYSLRFPMTITPRYIPGSAILNGGANRSSRAGLSPDTDAVPDASTITPPWAAAGINNHPTQLRVDLQPGFELSQVESLHHRVRRKPLHGNGDTLFLDASAHQANSDFVLQWAPRKKAAPQIELFTEATDTDTYHLLMITPPATELVNTVPPREVIFIIDTSGSMGGEPIRQAKKALTWALDRLRPEDSFNIIEFNSGSWPLFGSAQPANQARLDKAKAFVDQLQARGGTQMMPALESALCGYCGSAERLRQVIFLTDGAVGNEDQLFRFIKTRLGDSRLFTVGIGSAPNTYFMRKAAETGRGTFTYIGNLQTAGETMAQLFATLESPMMTDLKIHWPDLSGIEEPPHILPNPLPDIYGNRPAVILVKGDLPTGFELAGKVAGTSWRQPVDITEPPTGPGIQALWGRQQIEALTDRRRYSSSEKLKDSLRQQIIETALRHHLVSAFTSLVAVDISASRKSTEAGTSHLIANNSPGGSQFGLASTATSAAPKLLTGSLLLGLGLILLITTRRQRLCPT